MVTRNQVVKSFEEFADEHAQIGHFFEGQIFNFDTSGTTNGISMILDAEPHALSESTLSYGWKLYMGDLVQKDLGNRRDVLSDTLLVFLDFVAWAQHPDRDWVFERTSNINEFEDSFDCEMSGVWATIKLKTSSPFDRCAIPTR